MTTRFSSQQVMDGLTPFQRKTVEHVDERFYGTNHPTRRYLVADETGLGKSLVARGLIARTIERLQDDPSVNRIDIIYVCSSGDIAEQNLKRLDVLGTGGTRHSSRLTLLARDSGSLRGDPQPEVGKRVNLVSFTPGTSFSLGNSYGQIDERALLYIVLRDELELDRREQRRARIVLQGSAGRDSLSYRVGAMEWQFEKDRAADREVPDPAIIRPFLKSIKKRGLLARFQGAVDEVGQRQKLGDDEWGVCRNLVGELRAELAKSATDALEPDLIILDEFQRFRHLLDLEDRVHGEAAELAHTLFNHDAARVLLLSATPYKPFTYSEEAAAGDDHAVDLRRILSFLSQNDETTERIVGGLHDYRSAIVTGHPTMTLRRGLESDLTNLMCRTERPKLGDDEMLDERAEVIDDVRADDMKAYARLAAFGKHLAAPFPVDYWKSTPYFVNFGDGYRFTDRLRDALTGSSTRAEALEQLDGIQRLDSNAVKNLDSIEPGNARMRSLVESTVGQGWWRLLWMPPSLPYEPLDGPFASDEAASMTKRLIFSSWTSTPTAIASLVSHEALSAVAGDQAALTSAVRRFPWRIERRDGVARPGAMTTFSLFWPSPRAARAVNPLTSPPPNALAGRGPGNAEPWYWTELFLRGGAIPTSIDINAAVDALSGIADDDDGSESSEGGLGAHVQLAFELDRRELGTGDERRTTRPDDLDDVLEHLARYGPGNVALRCIERLVGTTTEVSELAKWQSAALISGALRTVFNRPESTLLFDSLMPDTVSWRAVLTYCRWGNLEAVLDEYLHHLGATARSTGFTDESLLAVAEEARTAITPRPARYEAFDPFDTEHRIPFTARFALRYGTKRGTLANGNTERPTEVRAAFNSPFWPYVLATTSVGQEGIDFHWWCRNATHWNTPASPVDFEQREGRVHRYGGLAIRRNLATAHKSEIVTAARLGEHPWDAAYRLGAEAVLDQPESTMGGLKPHWIAPGACGVQRQLYMYPLSRDQQRYERLKDDLTLYRLTFGQPRQEDLLELLHKRGVHHDAEAARELRLDLSPPTPPADSQARA